MIFFYPILARKILSMQIILGLIEHFQRKAYNNFVSLAVFSFCADYFIKSILLIIAVIFILRTARFRRIQIKRVFSFGLLSQ